MQEQQNHFVFEVKDRYKTMGRTLSNIYRRRGKIMYEHDLYAESDIDMVVDAISSSLERGENVRAYFINGERSKGMLITREGKPKSIPTNELYATSHHVGTMSYQDAMNPYGDN